MSETKNTNDIQVPMHIPPQVNGVRHSHLGPILAILVILILLIFCGLYIWGGILTREAALRGEVPVQNTESETPATQPEAASDSLESIEADITSTDFRALDTEIQNIDSALENALAQ